MAKYVVQISDEQQVEVDVAPGAPELTAIELAFVADDPVGTVRELGGGFKALGSRTWARFDVPVTRDGERVASARVLVCSLAPLAEVA